MIIAGREILREYTKKHAQARTPIDSWVKRVEQCTCKTFAEVKRVFPTADYIKDTLIVFNVGGNNFRVLALVKYHANLLIVKWVGTHAEYDKLNL